MKSNLIFLTVLVLLFLFFVGCDSDQNTGNPSFENPPFENIPNINRYDTIFIGEYCNNGSVSCVFNGKCSWFFKSYDG